ncbi:MAG: PA2169 family four-helix-bundle protein [Rhizobacter sp.]|nr:PA2169 family four-helix-bundle protein [Chlorobiales bacterium]
MATSTVHGSETLTNDQVIGHLNSLIETCKDGQHGYNTAAEDVKNPDLKTLFMRYGQQRTQYIGELQAEVRRLGGDPEKTSSVVGAMHRGWINIKSAVAGGDENAVLAECERGEDSAVETYKKALEESFPSELRAVVSKQHEGILEAHDKIRSLTKMTEKK